ncbi:MAG: bifunctional 2-polyprenyl-6-hydroxyphenol methylase/3-demethylubiquinol 3-O-methyltransferase UbiG [Pseudomonadota bacterium]
MAASADPQEMAKFEQLADTWWDPTGPFWPLHKLNTVRTNYIRDVVSAHRGDSSPTDSAAPLAGVRMLDIGCGGGLLSEAMARLGAEVHGVDVVERNVQIAERHRPAELDANLRYEHGSVEALTARAAAPYDVVLNMEVVEHVVDLPTFMAHCCSLVRADGLMFVSTINRNPISFLSAIVGAEYVLRWLPRGTHDWRKFPTPHELQRMLTENGHAITERKGVRVNPLTRKFSLTESLVINYMLVAHPVSPAT